MRPNRLWMVTGRTYQARRRIAAYFAAQHAISAGEAVPYAPQNGPEREAFADLVARRIVQHSDAGSYFMLFDVYDAYEEARRRRMVPIVIGLAVATALIAMLFYRG